MKSTNIQQRVIEAMKDWDSIRLRSELEVYIKTDSDEELEEMFFDDIATEEEQQARKLNS